MSRYLRRRCKCGKATYRSQEEARSGIREIPLHRGYHLLKPYLCEFENWHVGHDHKMYEVFTILKRAGCTNADSALL